MRGRTQQNTIFKILGTSPFEILPPNPKRKAIMLSPLAGTRTTGGVLTAQTFAAGNHNWQVPDSVTSVVDMYVWGSGGDGGPDDGIGAGGGGGGGGGFANTGPLTVVPLDLWPISVDAHGNEGFSAITSPAAVVLAKANSGDNGAVNAGGAGGTGLVGNQTFDGGSGGIVGFGNRDGGGGGGGAGSFANGSAGPSPPGGAGGGAATHLGYGAGGHGGDGTDLNFPAPPTPGLSPGGGGGGKAFGGPGFAAPGAGGFAVVFYNTPVVSIAGAVSLSFRQDVVAGRGSLNWLAGNSFPLIVSDDEVGDAIGLPWWIASDVAGVAVQITEFLYAD